jgi:phosphonate transport system ATP-binding protein
MAAEALAASRHFTAPPASAAAGPDAVRMKGVWAAYVAREYALRDVSLQVGAGECRVVVGPSGSGKSTLVKVIAGLVPAARGRVEVLGKPLRRGGPPRDVRRRIGYIPQNLGLVASATARENVLLGALSRTSPLRSCMGMFAPAEHEEAMRALEATGLAALAERRAHQLSGGERRRLAVARALMQRPDLLLADEFLSELDDVTAGRVLESLQRAREALGMAVVMVEHNLGVACAFADRVTVVNAGAIVADAPACDVTPDRLRALFVHGGAGAG